MGGQIGRWPGPNRSSAHCRPGSMEHLTVTYSLLLQRVMYGSQCQCVHLVAAKLAPRPAHVWSHEQVAVKRKREMAMKHRHATCHCSSVCFVSLPPEVFSLCSGIGYRCATSTCPPSSPTGRLMLHRIVNLIIKYQGGCSLTCVHQRCRLRQT